VKRRVAMRRTGIVLALVTAISICAACGEAPKVVQGSVVSYDPASKVIVIRDECPPKAEITLAVGKADTGAEPQPNDVVRAAYRAEGGTNSALRIMNITRQKELGFLSKATGLNKCN
jgi:hypothetical protein